MYVWQQAGGQRHARPAIHHGALDFGATFTALCGGELAVGENDVHGPGRPWLDPTCPACDTAFRRVLGVSPPRANAGNPAGPSPSGSGIRRQPKVKC